MFEIMIECPLQGVYFAFHRRWISNVTLNFTLDADRNPATFGKHVLIHSSGPGASRFYYFNHLYSGWQVMSPIQNYGNTFAPPGIPDNVHPFALHSWQLVFQWTAPISPAPWRSASTT